MTGAGPRTEPMSEPRPGLRGVLQVRDMRLLLGGFVTSRTGDFLYSVALVVFVAEATGSAAWVSAASLVRLLPVVFLAPVAGVVGDRLPVRSLLVGCDLGQAAAMFAMAGCVAAGTPPAYVLLLAAVSSALSTPYFPVLTAVTPRLVAENQLAATNTFVGTVENLALILGPAIGGLLLALGPPSIPIAINAGTFLASAVLVSLVRHAGRPGDVAGRDTNGTHGTEEQTDAAGSPGGEGTTFLGQLAEGARATVTDRGVAILVLFTCAVTFVYGFELVYLVFVADERLGTGSEGIGYLNTALGAGGALGALLTNRLAGSPRVRLVLLVTLLGSGLPLGLLAVVHQPWLAYFLLGVEGVASIALDVIVVTALQRVVRAGLLGRVSSIVDSLTVLAILLGNVAAVALLDATSLTTSLWVAGAIVPVLAVVLVPSLRDLEARYNASREELAPEVRDLEASGLLMDAPRTVVERVASAAVREEVPAGTALLHQGDLPDDVFVLVSGRFDIVADGRTINTVTAPGYVGEIGLVQRRRRTASVSAAEDCVVLRIPGQDFLAAVSGALPVALQTEMAARLDRFGGDQPGEGRTG